LVSIATVTGSGFLPLRVVNRGYLADNLHGLRNTRSSQTTASRYVRGTSAIVRGNGAPRPQEHLACRMGRAKCDPPRIPVHRARRGVASGRPGPEPRGLRRDQLGARRGRAAGGPVQPAATLPAGFLAVEGALLAIGGAVALISALAAVRSARTRRVGAGPRPWRLERSEWS
jgi:hypothetical protein